MPDLAPAQVRLRLIEQALVFARAAPKLPGVLRISLLGSIATRKPDPKDVDLLVRVTDDADIARLAACGRRLQGGVQGLNRGADVFLADEDGRYLGRTCPWKQCGQGARASCDALHCGRRPHLHDDLRVVTLAAATIADPPVDLWPAVRRNRPDLPQDLERMLAAFENGGG